MLYLIILLTIGLANNFGLRFAIDLYLEFGSILLVFLAASSSDAYVIFKASVTSSPIFLSCNSGKSDNGKANPWLITLNLPSFIVLTLNFLFAKNANLSSVSGHLLSISI